MTRERILTVASWFAVLLMMAMICWQLAGAFEPEYPEPTVRYTNTAFKSLEYQHAECKVRRLRAERFIESLSNGHLK